MQRNIEISPIYSELKNFTEIETFIKKYHTILGKEGLFNEIMDRYTNLYISKRTIIKCIENNLIILKKIKAKEILNDK